MSVYILYLEAVMPLPYLIGNQVEIIPDYAFVLCCNLISIDSITYYSANFYIERTRVVSLNSSYGIQLATLIVTQSTSF